MNQHPLQKQLRNPLTKQRDERDRRRIASVFPELQSNVHPGCLVLRRYLDRRPEKFFDRTSYRIYLNWLQERDANDHRALNKYVDQFSGEIDSALQFLREMNSQSLHDESLPSTDEYSLVQKIDSYIHPSYLRVVEAIFAPLIRPIAHFSRVRRGKGTDGLDVRNVVQELRSHEPEVRLTLPYRHIIRNGIAHGGIVFRAGEIRYRDKKGNEETYSIQSVVRAFDDLLDTSNGLALALKVFYLTRRKRGYKQPRQLLIEELQEETWTPWWRIDGCVESDISGKTQLVLYARPQSNHYGIVQFSVVQSGILAEFFAPGYDRYLLSLQSRRAWPGWAAFDGGKLKRLREAQVDDLVRYRGVVENDLVFYVPLVSIPKILGKSVILLESLKLHLPLAAQQMRENLGVPSIVCRNARIHRNSWGAVLRADVVMEGINGKSAVDSIVKYRGRIARLARRYARKLNRSTVAAYLPLAFLQANIYQRDYRTRRFGEVGLDKDLICTLRFQRMRRIESPDIIGATVHVIGKWRIAWNRRWLETWCRDAKDLT